MRQLGAPRPKTFRPSAGYADPYLYSVRSLTWVVIWSNYPYKLKVLLNTSNLRSTRVWGREPPRIESRFAEHRPPPLNVALSFFVYFHICWCRWLTVIHFLRGYLKRFWRYVVVLGGSWKWCEASWIDIGCLGSVLETCRECLWQVLGTVLRYLEDVVKPSWSVLGVFLVVWEVPWECLVGFYGALNCFYFDVLFLDEIWKVFYISLSH